MSIYAKLKQRAAATRPARVGWPDERFQVTSFEAAAGNAATFVTDDTTAMIASPFLISSSTRPEALPPASATR